MVEQYKPLKKELKKALIDIENDFDEFNKNTDLAQRTDIIKRLQRKMDAADKLQKDLDLEFGVLKEMKQEKVHAKKFTEMRRRYEAARKTFASHKDDWETQKNRAEAIKKPRTKGEQLQRDARDKVLDNIDTLNKQDNQITGITKVAHETAGTTTAILGNLRSQRDKITDAIQDTRQANQNVALGKQLVNSMSRKECCYKTLLYLLIVVLFAAIVAMGIVRLTK